MHPTLEKMPDHKLSSGNHAGFEWLVLHNGIGYRCGYVLIPANHPWYSQNYETIDCSVHGGLTYGQSDTESGFWLGFDCAHYGDAQDPELPNECEMRMSGVIRTQSYVEQQCKNLCEQAAKASQLAPSNDSQTCSPL